MLSKLKAALDATGYEFTFASWSHSPESDYGVYMLGGQNELSADGNSGAEIALEGYVDYFTRDASLTPKLKIESALRSLGISWTLNSVQYEEDGFIHYEWEWRDVTNGTN